MFLPSTESRIDLVAERIRRNRAAPNGDGGPRQRSLVINLVGGPGCGKTALLHATLLRLRGRLSIGAIMNDRAHSNHDDSQAVGLMNFKGSDVVMIECGGDEPRSRPETCQQLNVAMFSASGGDVTLCGRAADLVREADVVLLSKADLLPFEPFDMERFRQAAAAVNPHVLVLPISAVNGIGIDEWCDWMCDQVHLCRRSPLDASCTGGEYFCG